MTVLWAAKSPWEKFSRATFMPASIIRCITSGDSEAGPMVQTILVLCPGSPAGLRRRRGVQRDSASSQPLPVRGRRSAGRGDGPPSLYREATRGKGERRGRAVPVRLIPGGALLGYCAARAPVRRRGREMTAFLASLAFVVLAEMGDKTQLLAMAFAAKFRWQTVLWAVFVATAANHLGGCCGRGLARLGRAARYDQARRGGVLHSLRALDDPRRPPRGGGRALPLQSLLDRGRGVLHRGDGRQDPAGDDLARGRVPRGLDGLDGHDPRDDGLERARHRRSAT